MRSNLLKFLCLSLLVAIRNALTCGYCSPKNSQDKECRTYTQISKVWSLIDGVQTSVDCAQCFKMVGEFEIRDSSTPLMDSLSDHFESNEVMRMLQGGYIEDV